MTVDRGYFCGKLRESSTSLYRCDRAAGHTGDHRAHSDDRDEPVFWSNEHRASLSVKIVPLDPRAEALGPFLCESFHCNHGQFQYYYRSQSHKHILDPSVHYDVQAQVVND